MLHRVIGVLCALLLGVSCASMTSHQSTATLAPIVAEAPTSAPVGSTAPKKVVKPTGHAFVLTLTDQNGLHPAGIPVKVSGPQTRSFVTDPAGQLKLDVPGGIYDFAVVTGCQPDLLVQQGGTAHVGIDPARPSSGTLKVTWRHRFGPAPPVFSDQVSNWKVGQKVHLTYAVTDRCTGQKGAGASFKTFRFAPATNLKLVGTPVMKAGGDGRAAVDVACTKPGETHLFAKDSVNPSDSLDLVAQTAGYGGVPRCV